MPGANPIIQGFGDAPLAASPTVGYEPPAGEAGPSNRGFMGSASTLGSGTLAGFSHVDNTSSHVAMLVVGAALVVAFLYWGGFSFGVDAGVIRK